MYKKGFTLIELLMVVAIIGILSTVILARTDSGKGQARDTRRISDISQIQLGLEAYFANSPQTDKHYPEALSELSSGGYLDQGLLTDQLGQPYKYIRGGDSKSYCLGAKLENSSNQAIQQSSSCDVGDADYNYKVER